MKTVCTKHQQAYNSEDSCPYCPEVPETTRTASVTLKSIAAAGRSVHGTLNGTTIYINQKTWQQLTQDPDATYWLDFGAPKTPTDPVGYYPMHWQFGEPEEFTEFVQALEDTRDGWVSSNC